MATIVDGDVMTTPVLCGNEIYLTTFTGTIYRLEAKTGKILKASTLQATSLPTIAGNSIYTTKRLQVEGKVSEAVCELDKREAFGSSVRSSCGRRPTWIARYKPFRC